MDGLFLLVGLAWLPVDAGQYTTAITTARDAAFIQSGLRTSWDTVAAATAKKTPPALAQGFAAANAYRRREAIIRTHSYGTYTFTPTKAAVSFSWSF